MNVREWNRELITNTQDFKTSATFPQRDSRSYGRRKSSLVFGFNSRNVWYESFVRNVNSKSMVNQHIHDIEE